MDSSQNVLGGGGGGGGELVGKLPPLDRTLVGHVVLLMGLHKTITIAAYIDETMYHGMLCSGSIVHDYTLPHLSNHFPLHGDTTLLHCSLSVSWSCEKLYVVFRLHPWFEAKLIIISNTRYVK